MDRYTFFGRVGETGGNRVETISELRCTHNIHYVFVFVASQIFYFGLFGWDYSASLD